MFIIRQNNKFEAMSITNISKARSLSANICQSRISLTPLFSQKIRNTREPPFSLAIQKKKDYSTKNYCSSTLSSGGDKKSRNTKESLDVAPRKNSLGDFEKEIGFLPGFKKQMAFDRETIRRSTKSSLGHILRSPNGLVPFQYGTVEKEDNLLEETETLESRINKSADKRELCRDNSSSLKNVDKFTNIQKTKKSSTYKIRPATKIYDLKENELKGNENNEKANAVEIERISVCLAKGNHLSLREKFKNKEAINSQQKNKNLIECLQGFNISLSKALDDDLESQSFGLGESIIQIQNVTNESSFVEEGDRELLDQLQVHRERGQVKRGWRKLPSDFLKEN